MIIVIALAVILIVSIIAAFFYVKFMTGKHKNRLIKLKERYLKQGHDEQEIMGFEYLLLRELNYIRNYIIFQIVGKLCEMLSIIFSVSSFSFTFIVDESPIFLIGKQAVPLLSVVMIIAVIYIVPSKRWAEYMQAWRDLDYIVNCLLENTLTLEKVPESLKRIEESIASDKN